MLEGRRAACKTGPWLLERRMQWYQAEPVLHASRVRDERSRPTMAPVTPMILSRPGRPAVSCGREAPGRHRIATGLRPDLEEALPLQLERARNVRRAGVGAETRESTFSRSGTSSTPLPRRWATAMASGLRSLASVVFTKRAYPGRARSGEQIGCGPVQASGSAGQFTRMPGCRVR